MRYAGDVSEMRQSQRCVSHSYMERCVKVEEMGFAQDFGRKRVNNTPSIFFLLFAKTTNNILLFAPPQNKISGSVLFR